MKQGIREQMVGDLRAHLEVALQVPNEEPRAADGPPGKAPRRLLGFLMSDDGRPVQLTAGDLYDLQADAFVVDGDLGSIGIVHCLDGEQGSHAPLAEQVRGWVEDAAHLRHLMAMRKENQRARQNDRGEFLPTVELVFVVNMEPADAGPASKNNAPASVLRQELQRLKARTELLHAINVNWVRWSAEAGQDIRKDAWRRGFSWLLLETRQWLARPSPEAGAEAIEWNRLTTLNLRVRGGRAWTVAPWEPAGGVEVHVLHGPNGSGKSSLAEAFEFALTGRSSRVSGDDASQGPGDLGALAWRNRFGVASEHAGASVSLRKAPEAAGAMGARGTADQGGLLDGLFGDGSQGHQLARATGESAWQPQARGTRPAARGIQGRSFRLDQEGCDLLARGTAERRGAHIWECFFDHATGHASPRGEASRKLGECVARFVGEDTQGQPPLGRDDLERALSPVDGKDAEDWLGLLRHEKVGMPEAWVERVAEADPELVQRLKARSGSGLDDLERLLSLGHAMVGSFVQWLNEDFAKCLGALGETVFEVRRVTDDAYREAYSEWLGWVARADLLDKASFVTATLRCLDASHNLEAPLRDMRGLGDSDAIQKRHWESVRARDRARHQLTRLQRGGEGDEGLEAVRILEVPEQDLVDQLRSAVKAGLWENPGNPAQSILSREREGRLGQLLREGGVETLDQIHVAGAKGWTQRLTTRHREWMAMRQWGERHGPAGWGNPDAWAKSLRDAAEGLRHSLQDLRNQEKTEANKLQEEAPQLPRAVQELVELMTPASWAYAPIDMEWKAVPDTGAVRTLKLASRGLELSKVLNTAEVNTAGLALFLLCAPRVSNSYRALFLDDPFQNMDELTVTTVARAMSKWLRVLGQFPRWNGWRVVLLLHGADDCERVVQEVPSVFYRIPWNSPDEGAALGAGDVEHVKGVGSTRADLFDCVTFMGLAWDETRGLVDPKAEAKAKEPKAKPGA